MFSCENIKEFLGESLEQNQIQEKPSCMIIIFGASGDLTNRKVIPGIHSLNCESRIGTNTQIIGVARTKMTNEEFRDSLEESVKNYSRLKPGKTTYCEPWDSFAKKITYLYGDYDDPKTYQNLVQHLLDLNQKFKTPLNYLFYCATPPQLYPIILRHLAQFKLNQNRDSFWSRIIIEKPFGSNLETAIELHKVVNSIFTHSQVFYIDHYLGKETVQSILTFRFANTIFEPIWNRNYIESVHVNVMESVDVGGRGNYYDKSGVIRDMLVNHLLQLLCLIAMEPPPRYTSDYLRREKIKLLQSIKPISCSNFAIGQYHGYRSEQKISKDSNTPTYADVDLEIDNWRWQGVRFRLSSGKKLAKKETEIVLTFKQPPFSMFSTSLESVCKNQLRIVIQPDERIELKMLSKIPGAGMKTQPMKLTYLYSQGEPLPDAYERLLLDVMLGDSSLFTSAEEQRLSWKLFDSITDHGIPIQYVSTLGTNSLSSLVSQVNYLLPRKTDDIRVLVPEDVAKMYATMVATTARQFIQKKGIFTMALSGGASPVKPYELVAQEPDLDWSKIHVFLVDERCVPPDDKDSNYHMINETLLSKVKIPPENIHRIHTEFEPEKAAQLYEEEIEKFFGNQKSIKNSTFFLIYFFWEWETMDTQLHYSQVRIQYRKQREK
eukprot:Anaeramoba_ignava/c20053_g1_i1.p1 GENE.c20053_g1_i1~~c20053_g1_i1.p1  ORF type:complete len:661 (+),score=199.11 c20053_g1_i1:50-2032(+)